MVYINTFNVNQAADALNVIVATDTGETITDVKLWTQDTFKDYTQALDFTSKLSQTTNTETFTISASEIGESKLTGIYFIEITDSTPEEGECDGCSNIQLGVATDFTRFVYCITEYLCALESCCGDCNQELNKALTMNLYINNLRNSLQLGNFTTAITFWKNLSRACPGECTECGELEGVARAGLGFQTLGNNLLLY